MSLPSALPMEQIVSWPDPCVRNLMITHAYAELSAALRRWSADAANWCTFATWASKQAGQTIRGEDLQRTLEHRLELSPEVGDALGALVRAARAAGVRLDVLGLRERVTKIVDPAAAFNRASAAVSRGNTKVFAELGPLFARFVETFNQDAAPDEAKLADFVSSLRPGPAPEGQDGLREAFAAYYRAGFEQDRGERLQWMLLGNLLIGQHEQVRLQPEIAEALNASLGKPAELRARVMAVLIPGFWQLWRQRMSRWLGRDLPLDRAIDRLIAAIQREVRQVITELMMTLAFPHEVLRLGRDLKSVFPADLQTLRLPRLLTLLAALDPTSDNVRDSGARDWADLGERMHYIADLFRCYACQGELSQPPFNPEQIVAIVAGRRPEGRL